MTISFWNLENKIYSPITKRYFKEVISSYSNDNFRSSIVMLYTLVICDLLYKLQELKDMGDTSATHLLEEIDSARANLVYSRSAWEKDLINKISERTNLLEDHTITNIDYLQKHRNLCAHPSLDEDYELFSPNKETVAAHIRNTLEEIFIKPPIFIKEITSLLVEDLSVKKYTYINDYENLSKYLNNKYFSRMTDKMFLNVFKVIWKFVYILNNPECVTNRQINNMCLQVMLDLKKLEVLRHIKDTPSHYSNILLSDEEKLSLITNLCCSTPQLYSSFPETFQSELSTALATATIPLKLLTWFKYDNLYDYHYIILDFIEKNPQIILSKDFSDKIRNYFSSNGDLSYWIDISILYFSKSSDFNTADKRFDTHISPIIEILTEPQLKNLLTVINDNGQIHRRGRSYEDNTIIVHKTSTRLNLDPKYFAEFENFEYKNSEAD